MYRFASLTKWHVLGVIGVLALGMVAATAIAGVLVSNQASAHGGDATLVHACVNQTNAVVRIAHPGPGDENTDCAVGVGPDWSNVHLDDEWLGAGTGSLSPANLTDNVGIGTATPNEQLEITGNFRLPATTATEGIIMSDGNLFIHNFGQFNFFAGENAGNLTMPVGLGSNTGVGVNTLSSNTMGFANAATGHNALSDNRTGNRNTATGQGALSFNRTGNRNTATGQSALFFNTTGNRNTATGQSALFSNTTGSNNTASGGTALSDNTTGTLNTGIGYNANVSSGDLSNATAIGANAIVDASNKIQLGDNNVTEVQINGYTKLALTAGMPPAVDCDEVSEHGRMKVDATAGVSLLYICTADGWVSK